MPFLERVQVSFAAPDGLTRYRVVAVATHGIRAMGSASSSFEVRKSLMIEPAMPRFGHVGDQLKVRGLVFNKTERPLTAEVSLEVGKQATLRPGAPAKARVTVDAGGAVAVDFPVVLTAVGTESWRWHVVSTSGSEGVSGSGSASASGSLEDSVAILFPVTHAQASLRDVQHLQVLPGLTDLLAGVDPAVLEIPESVTVRIAAHPLAAVGEGLEQLLQYPYGCVEQTGSSLLPWLSLRDFPGLLPVGRRDATNFTGSFLC